MLKAMTPQEYVERAVTLRIIGHEWYVTISFLDRDTKDPPRQAYLVFPSFPTQEEAEECRQRLMYILEHIVRFALGAYDDGRLSSC